jgi:hypothetical protein
MAGEFVSQMLPALRRANPAIAVYVQIRTDSQPTALARLVSGLGPVSVSILTQRQDVQDAINVASVFFGAGHQDPQQSVPAATAAQPTMTAESGDSTAGLMILGVIAVIFLLPGGKKKEKPA